jgi:uncharacterized SAM-binding protein YcdF (DUF218 family)
MLDAWHFQAWRAAQRMKQWALDHVLWPWIVLAFVALYAAGFVRFMADLPETPRSVPPVDAIVTLTGGDSRLDAAVALFEKGTGERLLISGVHPETTKAELRKLARGKARFDCCTDLGYAAEDTHGNAEETAAWARFYRYRRLLVVTARYHMPRSLTEFHAAMPDVTLVPYPVEPESIDLKGWWHNPRALRVLHGEYAKYLAATFMSAMGLEPRTLDGSALRGEARAPS